MLVFMLKMTNGLTSPTRIGPSLIWLKIYAISVTVILIFDFLIIH